MGLRYGHGPGHQCWREVDETVALCKVLAELCHGCSAVPDRNIPPVQASGHRRDDFHTGDGGQIEMMACGRIEEGPHPRRPLLLDIAFDQRAAIAEIDRHLATLLDERLRDRLPTDRDGGERRGGRRLLSPRATWTEQPCLSEDVLQTVLKPVVPEPTIQGIA